MPARSDSDYEAALAKVLVGGALALGEGDLLRIRGEPPQRSLMLAAAEEAYRLGARHVRFELRDQRLNRARILHSREEYLDQVSQAEERDYLAVRDEGWHFLAIDGAEDPAMLEGLDMGRVKKLRAAAAKASEPLQRSLMANAAPWCVAPGPTDAWARKLLGKDGAKAGELWPLLAPILRLDEADPAAATRGHCAAIAARAARLNELGLVGLRFSAPGTDLRVALSKRSRWHGGGSVTQSGKAFMPNVPTEEVFTTPDARGTEGRLSCTRPVEVFGAAVEGAWMEFKAGKVVRSGATRNAEALEKYLETDPGACRLGEAALVDTSSPLWRAGLVFGSILLDENAACHVALGSGYPDAFEGAGAMGETERAAAGFNDSIVHLDFMIGSDGMDVAGIDSSGREVPLLRKGGFAI